MLWNYQCYGIGRESGNKKMAQIFNWHGIAMAKIWIEIESESEKIDTMAQIVGAVVVGITRELAVCPKLATTTHRWSYCLPLSFSDFCIGNIFHSGKESF